MKTITNPMATTKSEFVIRTNSSDSSAPLDASVSKFNRNHIVVRKRMHNIHNNDPCFILLNIYIFVFNSRLNNVY
jgi:hypothetical protein